MGNGLGGGPAHGSNHRGENRGKRARVFQSFAMKLRKATMEDVPAVMALLPAIVAEMHAAGNPQWHLGTYPLDSHFAQDIDRGDLWLAVDPSAEEAIVGFAAITMDQPVEYAGVGWDLDEPAVVPHRLAVSPSYRGRGIAQMFMRKCEETARECGSDRVRADTSERNGAMRHVLTKLGFEPHGTIVWTSYGAKYSELQFVCYQKLLR